MAKRAIDIAAHIPDYSGLPCAKLEDFKDLVLPEDIEITRQQLNDEYFEPYHIIMPAYVLKQLTVAAELSGQARIDATIKARDKAKFAHFCATRQGHSESRPMTNEVKAKLAEYNKQKRQQEKQERQSRLERLRKLPTDSIGNTAKPKRSKVPVFNDPEAQTLVSNKYPHIIPGTFKQDPEKPGGTLVDIKCQKCGSSRTVHMADVFQCRLCKQCRQSGK